MKLEYIFYLDDEASRARGYFEMRICTEPEGDEPGGSEYAIDIATIDFLQNRLKNVQKPYFYGEGMPMLVVAELDDDVIRRAVNEMLPNIHELATCIDSI